MGLKMTIEASKDGFTEHLESLRAAKAERAEAAQTQRDRVRFQAEADGILIAIRQVEAWVTDGTPGMDGSGG